MSNVENFDRPHEGRGQGYRPGPQRRPPTPARTGSPLLWLTIAGGALFLLIIFIATTVCFVVGMRHRILGDLTGRGGEVVLRLQAGEYDLDGTVQTEQWGVLHTHAGFVPAFAVRGQLPADDKQYRLDAVTRGMKISRVKPDGKTESRDLADVLGTWVQVGATADNAVLIQAIDKGGNGENRYRYSLSVPEGIFLAAVSSGGLELQEPLGRRPEVREGTKKLDDYAYRLRKAFGPASGVCRDFAEAQARQESAWLGSGADAGRCVAEHRASLDWKDPAETLYWLTVLHGRELTAEQIAAAREEFSFPIAESYAEARQWQRRKARLDEAPLPLEFVAADADAPDDFLGIVSMLMWMTQDCTGPKVTLISERTWGDGKIQWTERIFEYAYESQRRQHLEAMVKNAYKGMRADDKARPAAKRLLASIEQACKAKGPFVLWPENLYNFEHVLDMRACQHPAGHNAAGFPRDSRWFWRTLLEHNPELFSEENKRLIRERKSPYVDDTWVKHFPSHAPYHKDKVAKADDAKLIHHHVGKGPLATPLPQQAHQKLDLPLHGDD